MEVDAEGFGYPKVDMESCVDCGLCEKVCPLKNDSKKSGDQSIYGLRNKDEHIVQESTSGGGFCDSKICSRAGRHCLWSCL